MRTPESWLLSCLINSIWQVPLLFLAGKLTARLARNAGPLIEHRIWVTVLLAQGLLPECSAISSTWLPNLFQRTAASARSGHVAVTVGAGTVFSGSALPASMLAIVAAAYAVTCAWFAVRFLWNCIQLRHLRAASQALPTGADLSRLRDTCAARFGILPPEIAISSQTFAPFTMGIRRSVIVLPVKMLAAAEPDDLRAVIAHECAHIRRADFLRNLLYEFLALPVSYHPFLRFARHRLTETREMVCDNLAVESNGRPEYAQSLLRLASLLLHGTPSATPHAIGILDANTLERRLMQLTQMRKEIRGMQRAAIVAASAVFGLAACGSALALGAHVHAPAESSGTAYPKAVYVSSGRMAANRISGTLPKYPEAAKKAHIQGMVVLHGVINKMGDVEHLSAVSGPSQLRTSAMKAVKQWQYKPYLLNGKPVTVETTINVVYSLGRGPAAGKRSNQTRPGPPPPQR